MNTAIRIGSGKGSLGPAAWKRAHGRSHGIVVTIVLALTFMLAPQDSSAQIPIKPCPPGSANPPSGMVAWWPMGETSGHKIYDISGKGNNGTTAPGAVGSGSPNWGPQSGPGMVGNALLFFFKNYARVDNNPSLNFDKTGSFTIDAWIKGGDGPILGNLKATSPKLGYAFSISNDKLRFEMGAGLNIVPWIGPKIKPNAWNFVAVSVDRNLQKVSFYSASGILLPPPLVPSPPIPVPANATSGLPLDIGKCPGNPNGCITIDELEIYGRVIPWEDLNRIFKAKSKGKCVSIRRNTDVPE